MAHEFIIKNGFVSKGNSIVEGILSGQTFNLINTPVNNNSATEILVRNSTTGVVEYRDSSTLSGGGGGGQTITGYTYNETNNTFSIGISGGTPLDASINVVSGLTVTNDLIVSGSTGIGTDTPTEKLHIKSTTNAKIKIEADINDVDETDTADILLSQDGGISTSNIGISPDSINDLVIGVNSTTDPSIKFATRNDGTTFSTTADTKMTLSNEGNLGIGTIDPSERLHVVGKVRIEDGTEQNGYVLTCDATGVSSWKPVSGVSTTDVFVNSGSADVAAQQLTFTNTTGGTFNVTNAAALFSDNDVNVTGGTYNPNDGCVTFTTNSGSTFDICGFVSGLTNTFTTGGTYDSITELITFTNTTGGTYTVDLSTISSTGYWDIENGGLKSINQPAGSINGLSDGAVLVGGYFNSNNIYDGKSTTIINGINNTISGGTTSAIISTDFSNIIGRNGSKINHSAIIAGTNNNIEDTISDSDRSLIIGGNNNDINNSFNSAMLSTGSSTLSGGSSNIILGGANLNIIERNGGTLTYSSLIGGDDNTIQDTTGNSPRSTIIGGRLNTMANARDSVLMASTSSEISNTCTNVGIINGSNNDIFNSSSSTIIGGSVNTMSGGSESVMIGGNANKLLNAQRSVILGGRNITGTTDETVYVPNLNIGSIGSGVSLINLGLDVNGNVVTGTTINGGGNSGITGYTYDPTENEFAIGISGGTPFTAIIDEMVGLTINGELTVTGDTQLDSDLIVEGLTTLRGQTTIGNSFADSVDIVARVNSDIVPVFDNNVSLGDDERFWKELYVHNITGGTLNLFSGLTTNNSGTEILVRNSTTGQIEKRDVSTLTGVTSGGTMSFTVDGDNGTPFTITSGDTLTFEGSTGIDIGVAATDRVLIAVDYSGLDSVIMAATNGTGITVDGANDKLLIYDNDTATVKYINANQLPSSGGNNTTVTGYTYNPNNNTFTIGLSGSTSFDATINVVSGLTVTNNLIVSGNTGMGTDNPLEKLDVRGDVLIANPVDTASLTLSAVSTSNSVIDFDNEGVSTPYVRIEGTTFGGGVSGNLQFYTYPTGGPLSEVMVLTNNQRVGIGDITNNDVDKTLHVMGDFKMEETNAIFESDLNLSSGANVRLSAATTDKLPRISVSSPGDGGIAIGARGSTESGFPGYGANGDGYLYSSIDQNGLNIISAPSNPANTLPDYIRMYAGQDADGGIPDIHIQGRATTDSVRGYVGIHTDTPTETLHVDGTVRIVDGTEQLGYVLTCDATGVASWQPSSGGTGTGYWEIENGGLKSINQNAGTISGTSTGAILVGGYFTNNDITDGRASTIINGGANIISGASASAIISSTNSSIIQNNGSLQYSVIVGGLNNFIQGESSDSLIGGGINNEILDSVSSSIIGGNNNLVDDSDESGIYTSENSTLNKAPKSAIIGGNDHFLAAARSVIVGGSDNYIDSASRSVILGGSNITADTSNTVYVPQLNIRDVLDNEPVGTLGYDANGFVVDSNVSDITGGTLNGDVLTLINNNGNNITISGFSSGSTSGGFWVEGGEGNSLYDIKGNHILTGSSRYSMIAGGENNKITSHDYSGIFVGKDNVLTGSSIQSEVQNAIIGGTNNTISSLFGYMNNNTLIGGNTNFMSGRVNNSSIVGGSNHIINNSINDSVIIGGVNSRVVGSRSVVLGGNNMTGTTGSDTVFVPKLNIRDVSNGTPTMSLGVDANGLVVSAATGSDSGNCISELWVTNLESCSPLNINTYNQGNIYMGTQGGLPLVTVDITTPDEPGILFGEESFIKYNETQKKLKVGAESADGAKLVLETDGDEVLEVAADRTKVLQGDLETEDGNIIIKSGNSKSLIVEDIPDVSGANLGTDLDGKIIDLPSDSRCKLNIEEIPDVVDPILFLNALDGYQFEFHPRTRISATGKKHYGFKVDDFRDNFYDGNNISLAERQVNQIAKTFVRTCKTQFDIDGSGNKSTVDSMNYVDLIPFMVEGIKQLNTNINNITGGGKKFVQTLTLGSGKTTITHSLNDEDVIVQVVEVSTGQIIIPDHISNYTSNSVDIYVEEGGEYKIIIIG